MIETLVQVAEKAHRADLAEHLTDLSAAQRDMVEALVITGQMSEEDAIRFSMNHPAIRAATVEAAEMLVRGTPDDA